MSEKNILLKNEIFSVEEEKLKTTSFNPDWINLIALTKEMKVVLVCQYRFETKTNTLEIAKKAK